MLAMDSRLTSTVANCQTATWPCCIRRARGRTQRPGHVMAAPGRSERERPVAGDYRGGTFTRGALLRANTLRGMSRLETQSLPSTGTPWMRQQRLIPYACNAADFASAHALQHRRPQLGQTAPGERHPCMRRRGRGVDVDGFALELVANGSFVSGSPRQWPDPTRTLRQEWTD